MRRVLVTSVLPLLFSCGSTPDINPVAPSGALTSLAVSSGALVPAFDPATTDYELDSLSTLVPLTITPAQDVTIDGTPVRKGQAWSRTLTSLDDATVIAVTAKDAAGAPVTYRIHALPSDRPRFTTTVGAAPARGRVYLSPFRVDVTPNFSSAGWLYMLDELGRFVFYKKLPHPAMDFKRVVLPDGTVRYTYIMTDGEPQTASRVASTVYVLDDQLRQVRTIRLLPANGREAIATDLHDVLLVDDDHWISESYVLETVPDVMGLTSVPVVACVIQEVDRGQVVFDWDSTKVPELFAESTDGNSFSLPSWADYAHLNSIDLDPVNGNFVVSFRHLDEVLELDRKTGATVWKLGGKGDQFGLAADAKSSHQHDVRFLEPGHLIMFDNGNASKTTHIREYQLDPTTRVAQSTAAFAIDGHFSLAMGSVQKLGGRYFIGWGYRSPGEADVTEVDPTTKEKSFELTLEAGWVSYRARKLPY